MSVDVVVGCNVVVSLDGGLVLVVLIGNLESFSTVVVSTEGE